MPDILIFGIGLASGVVALMLFILSFIDPFLSNKQKFGYKLFSFILGLICLIFSVWLYCAVTVEPKIKEIDSRIVVTVKDAYDKQEYQIARLSDKIINVNKEFGATFPEGTIVEEIMDENPRLGVYFIRETPYYRIELPNGRIFTTKNNNNVK